MTISVDLWQWRLDDPDPRALTPDEDARAARFVFDRDRNRYIAGRARLRLILGRYQDVPAADVAFHYGPHGKPSVAGVFFNLSHSGDTALLAVTPDLDLGIDIEVARPIGMNVARVHFATSEVRALESLPPAARIEAFHRCWTRKEAYLKARGTGLSEDTTLFSVTLDVGDARLTAAADENPLDWSLHDLSPAPGLAGALALRANGRTVNLIWRGDGGSESDQTAHRKTSEISTVPFSPERSSRSAISP